MDYRSLVIELRHIQENKRGRDRDYLSLDLLASVHVVDRDEDVAGQYRVAFERLSGFDAGPYCVYVAVVRDQYVVVVADESAGAEGVVIVGRESCDQGFRPV